MLMQKQRELIIEYCLRMLKDGLTVGTSGNVSVRVGENIAITPSGVDYEALLPENICVITLDGKHVDGPDKPSTEVAMEDVPLVVELQQRPDDHQATFTVSS